MGYEDIIRFLSAFSILLPITIGLSFIKLLNLNEKIILWFLIIIGIFDNTLLITNQLGIHNLLFFHIFTHIEFIFLSIFYISILKPFVKSFYLYFILIFLLGIIFLFSFYNDYNNNIDSISRSILSSTFITLSIIYIYKSIFTKLNGFQSSKSISIINFTILFYFTTTFLIYLISNWVLINHLQLFKSTWLINHIITIISNFAFSIALWKTRTK